MLKLKIDKEYSKFMHLFEFSNRYFLFDISSSVSFEIDKITYEVITYCIQRQLSNEQNNFNILYNINELEKVEHEITDFLEKGFFNEKNIKSIPANFNIKSIEINIIHSCNLNCLYCYGNGGNYGSKNAIMTYDIAKKSVDFLIKESHNEKKLNIIYFGGEPLMNFEIIQETTLYAIEECTKNKKEVSFSITTNGTLLNKDIIDFFDKYKINVLISMDGTKENQDYLRPFKTNESSYDVIASNIIPFNKTRNKSAVRATITSVNMDIAKNIHAFEELYFTYCTMIPAETTDPKIKLSNIDYINLCMQYENLATKLLQNISENCILNPLEINIFSPLIKKLFRTLQSNYPCGAGRTMLCVSPDGQLYTCHRFADNINFTVGNVFDGINSNKQSSLSKTYINEDDDCKECWIRYLCGGGCIHSRLDNYTNNLSQNCKDNENCKFVRFLFELSIALYNEIMKHPELYELIGGKQVESIKV